MSKQGIDFRWGVPLLDNQPGFAKVYEFMLDHYAEVVTRDEFLCIIHLARYHYNSEKGESRPSLDTIAKQMGYAHKNSVSRLVQSLEQKGMIKVSRRPGFTSIYNAAPFTLHMMTLAGITPEGVTLEGGGGITPQCVGSITPQCVGVSHPSVPEEEKDKEKKEGEREEKKHFLSQAKKSDRERIRDILVDVLADGMMPETDYLLRPFTDAVDALVVEFRAIEGKTRLDHDLTSKIIGAIRSAYEEKGNSFPFKGATAPTRPVIGCIVEAGRKGKKRDAAADSWAEHAERSQQALAERQAERSVFAEEKDVWWEEKLEEMNGQMTDATFDAWLKGTTVSERGEVRIVIAVANEQAKEWLEHRLRPVIERTVMADGVMDVVFEVLP